MNQCLGCGASISDQDVACPRCQASRGGRPATPKAKWYHRQWIVLLAISPVGLGPFGLPLLWKSPNFSARTKLIWTLITLGWSIGFVWYCSAHILPAIREELNQLNATYQF